MGETLSVTREGGSVRFVSGKIQKYRIANQQMPAKGRTYLMFLSGDSIDNVMIITGYELREGKVYPLDASQQFSIYAGTNQVDFLNAVRERRPPYSSRSALSGSILAALRAGM